MGKAWEGQRQARRADALRPTGLDPAAERVFEGQVDTLTGAAQLLRLPVEDGALSDLQDEDGNPFFMVDYSSVGGPDPVQ